MASKVKKIKQKTHKATAKRFKVTAGGLVMHLGQGAGKGHGNSYMNRRQRRSPKGMRALGATKEIRKIRRLLNK